jgi:arylformamidase
VDRISLEALVGPAVVVHLPGVSEISVAALDQQAVPEGSRRLLFKTDNSGHTGEREFRRDYVALTSQAAEWIVDKGVGLVGIDYLSIGRYHQDGRATHPGPAGRRSSRG